MPNHSKPGATATQPTDPSADALLFVDGDGSVDPAQCAALLRPLASGLDLVIGLRHAPEPGSMNLPQRFGSGLACWLVRRLWRAPMRDTRCGWTVEMQVRARQENLRWTEVPVACHVRVGRSKISGTLSGVIGAARGILGTIGRLWWAQHRAHRLRRVGATPISASVASPDTRSSSP
ncbi:MAG: hypothetical protein ACT4PG_07395 [Panacagrimonas sp.]